MKKSTRILIFDKTPAVQVVVKTHETSCHYREPRIIGKHPVKGCRCMAHCGCQKHIYVPGLRPPYREATGHVGWEQAETFAQQWAEEHTRKNIEARREEKADESKRVEIGAAFDAFIETKRPLKPGDSDAMWKKFRTIKKGFMEFLGKYNSGRAESEKILYLDQITLDFLENKWRPTWTLETFHSINNRIGEFTSFLEWAGMEGREWVSKNVARALTRRKRNKEESQQTPPFTPPQYEMILKATEKMPIPEKMAAFIEVMRWCGSRISDTANMESSGIIDDPDAPGKKIWRYSAIKNGRKVEVPIPDEVYTRLAAFGPVKHFFCTGESTPHNAPDPWYRHFAKLWALCPPEALVVMDERNRECDPHPHMFRHTFAVESRKQGMSYAQIAVLIGDTEKTVKKYYSGYCKDFDKEAIRKARLAHRQIGKPVPTSLSAAQKEITQLRRLLAEVTPEVPASIN